ncbi:MAG: VWA domain-containing protein [Pyrinomonadaceae bacterium]
MPPLKFDLRSVLVVLLCLVGNGQSTTAQEIDKDDVVRVRTDLITVPVVVTDSRGRRVFGLAQEDFVISSEGRALKTQFFATGASRVALVFLLDASGSAREYLRDQRDAALSLFSRFGPQSEVAVVRFSDRATVAIPFSLDVQKARATFNFPAVSGRHTAIFNAALAALELLDKRKTDPSERRIVILTSDGLDTASTVKASEVIERARRDTVSFYIIHFPVFTPQDGHLAPRRAASGFRELAEKTGGHYFLIGDAKSVLAAHSQSELSPVFKAIEEDLAGQYVLGFYPDDSSRDVGPHPVAVNLTTNVRKYRVKTLREEYRLKQ